VRMACQVYSLGAVRYVASCRCTRLDFKLRDREPKNRKTTKTLEKHQNRQK